MPMITNIKPFILKYRRVIVVSIHASLIVLAYSLSFLSRLESSFYLSSEYSTLFALTIIPLLFSRLTSCWYFGIFKGLWSYTGIEDLLNIIKASFLGTLLFSLYIFAMTRGEGFPRSILIIDLAYNILFIGGIRMAVRLYKEGTGKIKLKASSDAKNVLIVGAGDAGEMILREMQHNPKLGYNPVGFVDDDRSKRKETIHGVAVLGNTRDMCRVVRDYSVDEVVVALPSATGKAMRRIVNTCKRAGVKFKTLPFIGNLIDGKVSVSQIRDVDIEDLLGRDAVDLDMSLIGKELANKVIMVTGAAGSIGSELVRQVALFNPKKIVLFERGENDLYNFEMELKRKSLNTKLVYFVGDVRERERVRECMELHRPTYIFHAAAYKHVPMMEMNPAEAVKNNIFGTKVLVDLACEYNVEKFVLISTDKAVRPTNVMGATKRVAELILQSKAASEGGNTHFIAVRFGNVLGSNGSVIPLFKKQIADGGPVTLTHPEITRYFMTIPEAVQLVIQAGAMGDGGEIFLLEMGEPVKIRDLAENLIRLSGLTPGEDIEIAYTGLRPGEKLYEELLIDGEGIKKTHHKKIWVLEGTKADTEFIDSILKDIEIASKEGKDSEVKSILKKLVPEYNLYSAKEGMIRLEPIPTLETFESATMH